MEPVVWMLAAGLAMDSFAVTVAWRLVNPCKLRNGLMLPPVLGVFQGGFLAIGWIGVSVISTAVESMVGWLAAAALLALGIKMVLSKSESLDAGEAGCGPVPGDASGPAISRDTHLAAEAAGRSATPRPTGSPDSDVSPGSPASGHTPGAASHTDDAAPSTTASVPPQPTDAPALPDSSPALTLTRPLTLWFAMSLGVATSLDALAAGLSLTTLTALPGSAAIITGATTFVFSLAGLLLAGPAGNMLGSASVKIGGAILIGLGVKTAYGVLTA